MVARQLVPLLLLLLFLLLLPRQPPLGGRAPTVDQAWIDTWTEHPRPFVWTTTADEILDTIAAYCQRLRTLDD